MARAEVVSQNEPNMVEHWLILSILDISRQSELDGPPIYRSTARPSLRLPIVCTGAAPYLHHTTPSVEAGVGGIWGWAGGCEGIKKPPVAAAARILIERVIDEVAVAGDPDNIVEQITQSHRDAIVLGRAVAGAGYCASGGVIAVAQHKVVIAGGL